MTILEKLIKELQNTPKEKLSVFFEHFTNSNNEYLKNEEKRKTQENEFKKNEEKRLKEERKEYFKKRYHIEVYKTCYECKHKLLFNNSKYDYRLYCPKCCVVRDLKSLNE